MREKNSYIHAHSSCTIVRSVKEKFVSPSFLILISLLQEMIQQQHSADL